MMSYFTQSVSSFLRESPTETCGHEMFLRCAALSPSSILKDFDYLTVFTNDYFPIFVTKTMQFTIKTSSWHSSSQEIWVSLCYCGKNQMHLFCQIFWNIPSSFVELISTCVPGLGPAALERESANYNPWIRPTYPLPGFGMKVLLEQSHTPLFSYCLRSLTATKVELNSCHRDCKACKNWPLTDAVLHLWSCLEEGC